MKSSASDRGAPRPLDAVALAHVRRRLQRQAEPPWLHAEVARRMGERLSIIKLHPARILDWGSFVGAGHGVLSQAYPKARVVTVEADEERRGATSAASRVPWWRALVGQVAVPTLRPHEVTAGGADLLWANMVLQGVVDPEAEMKVWHRSLAVDGFAMFSTLGPGSLRTLAELYAAEQWTEPFAPFVDMHDLGDMLVQSGFADPVMDQETITLTWASPQALLAELRTLGGNVDPRRTPGLRTPRWLGQLESALSRFAQPDGRTALSFEVVYGHAFKAAPRARATGETTVSLDEMRAMVRRTPEGDSA